ncbi:MAG TPA: hypothetical protein EYO09_03550, partial [Candidatus Poseidoniales archaeon]|nr:hypothetical protein [Candidatus Poseidoniales archaeon]
MFHGTVEKPSHEGGLLLSFNGQSPALGAHIIDEDENWIGKVDSVIGNVDNPLVHLLPMAKEVSVTKLIGRKVRIRPHQQGRGGDRRDGDRRGGDRRDGDRRGGDRRSGGHRGSGNEEMKPGDWKCSRCSNINFARRTECNRCSNRKPRDGGRGGDRGRGRFDDRQGGDRGGNRGGDRGG